MVNMLLAAMVHLLNKIEAIWLCLAKTRSTCEMSDLRGGRVTSYMIDIRYSAVAEFRGGQECMEH
jgi:hypothetical protein